MNVRQLMENSDMQNFPTRLVLTVTISLMVATIFFGIVSLFVPIRFFDYSDGQRSGLVNKISHKGILCKTWEGYLLVGNGQNIAPETFKFTVRDSSVVQKLEALGGKPATLTYRRFLFTSSCWGDTVYEVTDAI